MKENPSIDTPGDETLLSWELELNKPYEKIVICQICGCPILKDESYGNDHKKLCKDATVYCQSCGTPHHEDCWSLTGKCSTYGCNCYSATSRGLDDSCRSSEPLFIEASPDDEIPVIIKSTARSGVVYDDLHPLPKAAMRPFLSRELFCWIPDLSRVMSTFAILLELYAFPAYALFEVLKFVVTRNQDSSRDGSFRELLKPLINIFICMCVFATGFFFFLSGLAIPGIIYLVTALFSYYPSRELSRRFPRLKAKRTSALPESSRSKKRKKYRNSKEYKKAKKRKKRS